MRILVACEESQVVTNEFRKLGHEAYSCDIIDHSGDHDEWHIKDDVLLLLNGDCQFYTVDGTLHKINNKWDMIVAFPPCTDLAVSGAAWFERKRENGSQKKSIEFFMNFLNADCEKIVVENPIGIISGNYIKKHYPDLDKRYIFPKKPTQIIHPWMFGDNFSKSTCLWVKGLDPLIAETNEQPELEYFEWTDKNGKNKRQPQWFYDAFKLPPKERAKVRSKTFPGVAKAMAEQWGKNQNIGENAENCEIIEFPPKIDESENMAS